MKLQNKSLLVMAGLVVSTALSAGSSSGSGPPSRQALKEMLMSLENGAGLFTGIDGSLELGVNGSLEKEIRLSKNTLRTQSLPVSNVDFDALRASTTKTIDVEGLLKNPNTANISVPDLIDSTTGKRSYRIEDGDQLGELILKDRRAAVRAGVMSESSLPN